MYICIAVRGAGQFCVIGMHVVVVCFPPVKNTPVTVAMVHGTTYLIGQFNEHSWIL